MDQNILTAVEVAQLLRVEKQRVYELVRSNAIPFIKLGDRQYRFSRQAIENFLAAGGTQKEGSENVEK